jgi:hypothetical protein
VLSRYSASHAPDAKVGLYFHAMNAAVPKSEEEVLATCEKALCLAPSEWPITLPASKELLGEPEWYSFEHAAWALGESVRRAFVQHPHLKNKPALISKIVEVATCRNLRRGRQSFIMAIGFVAACSYASALTGSLDDQDVDGQVVYTLLKMRAGGFAHAVAPLITSEKTWIKRLAKKYIDRYPSVR